MSGNSSDSRDIGKTRVRNSKTSPGTRVTWPDVLAAVQDDETRSGIVRRLGDAGFLVDAFANQRTARIIVCERLVAYEDRLEAASGARLAPRGLAVRTLRRRLELELWP